MKTTFLVRDGLAQVVLHPETKLERTLLDMLQGDQAIAVHKAQFAETQGGYVRDFSRYPTSPFQDAAHLPDTVLVLRPVEPQEPTVVEKIPDDVDLVKKTDGSWLYRNHADTWQGCPPPFSQQDEGRDTLLMQPDHEYYCRSPEGHYQRYTLVGVDGTKAWRPLTDVDVKRLFGDRGFANPPDDTKTYYRVTQGGTWQTYDRGARVWVPASKALQDLVDSPDADASELRTMSMEMELILEHCAQVTGFSDRAKLDAIMSLVKSSMERRK